MSVPVAIPDECPWWVLPNDLADAYTEELRKEIGPEHPLFKELKYLKIIAKCEANDDVLVAHLKDTNRFYWVHLTWAEKVDQMPDRFPASAPLTLSELPSFFQQYLG